MNAVALDKNALNGLFENQKKLDDLFDSIFDDNTLLFSTAPVPVNSVTLRPESRVDRQASYKGNAMIESVNEMKHHPYFYILPMTLELTVIYWLITHLS